MNWMDPLSRLYYWRMKTTRHLSLQFVAAILVCISVSAPHSVAADTSIGETRIVIPEQIGFLQLDPSQKLSLHAAAAAAASCDPYRCAVFVGEDVFGRSEEEVLEDIDLIYSRFYQVEVLNEDISMDQEYFDNFKKALVSDLGGFTEFVKDSMLNMYKDSNVDELGKTPALLGPPQVEVLDQSREEASYIRFSVLGRIVHRLPEGDTREDTTSVVFGAMSVKSKLVMIIVYGAETDLQWAQEFFDSLALETLERNIAE